MSLSRLVSYLCAVVAAACISCGIAADPQDTRASACSVIESGTWWNRAFATQGGVFHVELSVAPSANDVDAIIGLSAGAASAATSLAALVRFNREGYIDARNASTFAAAEPVPYEAGQTYRIELEIDDVHHVYSVSVGEHHIARNFAFGAARASAMPLDHIAALIAPGGDAGATLQLCGFVATAGAAPADDCVIANGGGGLVTSALAASTGGVVIEAAVAPASASSDAVVGVASRGVDAVDGLAASLRFGPNGLVEARDGDTYRADVAVAYHAGTEYRFTLFIDLPSQTYSVVLFSYQEGWSAPVALARAYRFHTHEVAVEQIASASSNGRLDVCGIRNAAPPQLRDVRDGNFRVLPLPDNGALLSTDTQLTRLDTSGVPVDAMPSGGAVAVDGSGNFYIARLAGDALVVDSYTAALAKRWSIVHPVNGAAGRAFVDQMVVTTNGELLLEVADPTPRDVLWLALDGSIRRTASAPVGTTALGLARSGYAFAVAIAHGMAIELHDPSGRLVWRRQVTGDFTIYRVALADDRSVALAGTLMGTVDFGDGPIAPYATDDEIYWTAFVAALDANARTRFSHWVGGDSIRGLATNGQRIVLGYQAWTPLPWMHVDVWDAEGRVMASWGRSDTSFFGGNGDVGDVAITSANRVYANLEPIVYWSAARAQYPLLIALEP